MEMLINFVKELFKVIVTLLVELGLLKEEKALSLLS